MRNRHILKSLRQKYEAEVLHRPPRRGSESQTATEKRLTLQRKAERVKRRIQAETLCQKRKGDEAERRLMQRREDQRRREQRREETEKRWYRHIGYVAMSWIVRQSWRSMTHAVVALVLESFLSESDRTYSK